MRAIAHAHIDYEYSYQVPTVMKIDKPSRTQMAVRKWSCNVTARLAHFYEAFPYLRLRSDERLIADLFLIRILIFYSNVFLTVLPNKFIASETLRICINRENRDSQIPSLNIHV